MKLTELRIGPRNPWDAKTQLVAVVKLATDHSTVECVLSEETMRRLLDLCATEIAANAQRNVQDFVAAVTAVEGDKAATMLGVPE